MAGEQGRSLQNPEHDWRSNAMELSLILFSRDGRLWLTRDENRLAILPRVTIPKWRRVAQEARKAASNDLELSIFCLWEVGLIAGHYLVGQVESQDAHSHGLVSVSECQFGTTGLGDDVLEIVTDAHRTVFATDKDADPFKRIDWLIKLQELVQPLLGQAGLELTGVIEQINAAPPFSLLRLETTRVPMWFKAVGAPNLGEYCLTRSLDRLIPGTVPPLLATFPNWHAWLMEDSGGKRLDQSDDLQLWQFAATSMADLQIKSLQHVNELLHNGCADCRTATLVNHLEGFEEAMRRAMEHDQELDIVRLDRHQIRQVRDAISRAVHEVLEADVPDSLVHRDLSGGNIQVAPDHCYFIDWAHACIGHPFVCSQYIQVHFARLLGDNATSRSQIAELSMIYASRWRQVLSSLQVEAALRHSQLLAEYLYLLPANGRSFMDVLATRDGRAFSRSMTRRMWRESNANQPLQLSA